MKIQEINKKSELCELELLSVVFADINLVPKVLTIIDEEDFFYQKKNFIILIDCYKKNKNQISEFLSKKINTSQFLNYSLRNITDICNELKTISNSRKVLFLLETATQEIEPDNLQNYVSDLQRQIILSATNKTNELSSILSIIENYKKQQEFYKEKFKNGGGIIGIPTGYEKLDEVIDGIRSEHLWVIGGYTNMGKTAASLNIVASLIKQNKKVLFYSLEMSKTDILSRLLGIMTEQSGLSILKGFKHDEQKTKEAMEQIKKSDIAIHTEKNSIIDIQMSILEESIKKPIDLVVIDFLQLITAKGTKSEYETLTLIILEIQQLAKKLKIPIIVLSQISNEGARNSHDTVMSFKGSGSIASAADLAIEISPNEEDKLEWKRKMNEGEPVAMKWSIRKNRHGKVGYLDMEFNGRTGIFKPIEISKEL
mgnify:CR=1 FL=1